MKKIIALFLSLMMLVPVIGAMAEGEIAPMFYGGGTPLSIDPAKNSAVNGSNILKAAHCGLMGWQYVDGVPTLSPELAESYTISEDGLTYVFTLREGLKWSDGQDLLASSFVFAWNRAAGAELAADYNYMFDVVEGYDGSLPADMKLNVEADDAARTVTVKLKNPTPYFLELCAFPTYYPVREDLVDNEGIWATKPETYVGTGAFRMTKYVVDDVIAMEKNPYYWNADAVSLGGIECRLSEDAGAVLVAYENDSAYFIDDINSAEFQRLESTYPGELEFGDYIGTWYVLFNVHKDVSPTGKQLTVQEQSKARIALGMMPNRQELVEYVTAGGEAPATGFFPKALGDGLNADVRASDTYDTWYADTNTPSEENANYTKDQVTACQTLIDLGYAYEGSIEEGNIKFTDFPIIEFSFNNSGTNAMVIAYIQEVWNTFGITGTVNNEAWSTLQDKLKKGDAEAARMGWIADFNDTVNFLEIFLSNSGNNYPRLGRDIGDYTKASDVSKDAGLGAYWGLNGDQTWADAYDALVTEVKTTTDPEARAELCAQGERILMATGGVNPIYFYTRPRMTKPFVQNLMKLPTGDVIWTYVTITK